MGRQHVTEMLVPFVTPISTVALQMDDSSKINDTWTTLVKWGDIFEHRPRK